MLPVFEIGIVSAALCGLIMVAGGILLLYKGAVSLTQTSGDEAVSLEFQKMLKLTTRYPALGLFVIGLSFVMTGLTFSKPPAIRPLQIRGKITGAEPSAVTVRISAGQWMLQPSSEGTIAQTIYPNMDRLLVEVIAPGQRPRVYHKEIRSQELKSGTAALDEIVFAGVVVPKPEADPSSTRPVGVKLPPLSGRGSF